MTVQAHLAYPFLLVYLANYFLHYDLTWQHYAVLAFFSAAQDLDYIYPTIRFGKHVFDDDLRVNHHQWFAHWPITYAPIWIATIIWPNAWLVLMTIGTMSHLVMDTLYGDIMWLAPFSKRKFSFEPALLRGRDHFEWAKAYRKLRIYIVDWLVAGVVVVILVVEVAKSFKIS